MTEHPVGARRPPADPRQAANAADGSFGLALLLVALAGWVDMLGVTETGGVFVSFMSGNTTDLAKALVGADWRRGAFISAVIALFVFAGAVGALIECVSNEFGPPLVLLAEAGSLAAAAALFPVPAHIFCLVFAMGVQTTALRRAGGLTIGLTYVTGTLVQIGRSVGEGQIGRAGLYALVWGSLVIGAALAALAIGWSRLGALVLATTYAVALTVITAVQRGAQRAYRR